MFLLVPAYPGSLGTKAVKWLCVCVCACVHVRVLSDQFCQIYPTDFCQIFRVGRTMAVDDQSEISFFDSLKDVAKATIFCWLYPQS